MKVQWKTIFCIRLQLFNCTWIAVQSMQKLRKKVVKTSFHCNPNIAIGSMLKISLKIVKLKLISLYFSVQKSAEEPSVTNINYK